MASASSELIRHHRAEASPWLSLVLAAIVLFAWVLQNLFWLMLVVIVFIEHQGDLFLFLCRIARSLVALCALGVQLYTLGLTLSATRRVEPFRQRRREAPGGEDPCEDEGLALGGGRL
jgi:hypothetical protein